MGPFKGLKQVRNIVLDCLNNIHPIYHIKELMIKRELAKDEKLKNESWDRFLPHFKKRSIRSSKSSKKEDEDKRKKKKKEYTPFPPAQLPRKVDLQIESGEYFLSQAERKASALQKKMEQQIETSLQKQKEREKAFVAPKESIQQAKARPSVGGSSVVSVDSLKEKFKKMAEQKNNRS